MCFEPLNLPGKRQFNFLFVQKIFSWYGRTTNSKNFQKKRIHERLKSHISGFIHWISSKLLDITMGRFWK